MTSVVVVVAFAIVLLRLYLLYHDQSISIEVFSFVRACRWCINVTNLL